MPSAVSSAASSWTPQSDEELTRQIAKDIRKRAKEYEAVPFAFPSGSSGVTETVPLRLKLPIIFNQLLPDLFRFSYFVWVPDVPEDIVEDCIWALSLFIRVMEECSETVLRAVGHIKEGHDYRHSRYITLTNARVKLVRHFLRIGRALEALPYAKAMVDNECSGGDESWVENPTLFALYGETLVLARTDDARAVTMLRRAMLGNVPTTALTHVLTTRIFLSRALRNVGEDDEAKSHETWLITWFRKNPRIMHDADLKYLLLPPGHILNGLGGEGWFENRKRTAQTDQRLAKACRTCSAREPLATLSRCNNCKFVYYCSKDCQRANWKHHKAECRDRATIQDKVKAMSLTDPEGAKRTADWSLWCNTNHDANQVGLYHALSLHRDPQRGRTHIVLKHVEYAPTATKLKHKFRVLACGVFRVKDVLPVLEGLMGLDRGEGQEYIDGLLADIGSKGSNFDPIAPFLHLSFGDGITPWLSLGGTTVQGLKATKYDPHWRKTFNVGAPPGPLLLISGIKDVEGIF